MINKILIIVLFLAFSFLSICYAKTLPKVKEIQINQVNIIVEIADTQNLRERGLMYRKSLLKNHGMLFVFEQPRKVAFWMKNTLMDLDIAYIANDGVIFQIETMQKATLTPHPSCLPTKWALEMPVGYFKKHSVRVGDKVKL